MNPLTFKVLNNFHNIIHYLIIYFKEHLSLVKNKLTSLHGDIPSLSNLKVGISKIFTKIIIH